MALFEADGGAWRIEAMKKIKEYLKENLVKFKGCNDIKIIS